MEIEREGEFGVVVGLARNAPRDPKGRGKNERKNEKKKNKIRKEEKERKKFERRNLSVYVYGHTQTVYNIYM
jgi:hypothetical protein